MPSTKNFSSLELECQCCGENKMDEDFLVRLQNVRDQFGTMHLSSAYRCPTHNHAVSSTGLLGPHTTGHAVDILVSSYDAIRLIKIAVECGMEGVGVMQRGPYPQRFVHLDDLTIGVRPHIWS